MTISPFSGKVLSLNDSITHGTRAAIEAANRNSAGKEKIIDLSIGTLDMATDIRIDEGVCDFIRQNSDIIHAFAPVKGFQFLRESIAARVYRLHKLKFNPETEIIVTPGGIKGALTVMFHTFLNAGDEVIVPVPNWPHYMDMLKLHGAKPKAVLAHLSRQKGLTSQALNNAITDKTKLVILGDCINPTGKIYSSEELYSLAEIIAKHNIVRTSANNSPIQIIFDCPYEAHILKERAKTFAAIEVKLPETYSMRQCTVTVTGPGKTYGMHGDRIGYGLAPKETIDMAARAQVNLNSFASTYAQIATHVALHKDMDEIAINRAKNARANLEGAFKKLNKYLDIDAPDGGYFLFADFAQYSKLYEALGYKSADLFLLHEARIATISGCHFVQNIENAEKFRHFVRINCGRSLNVLDEAVDRITQAFCRLGQNQVPLSKGMYSQVVQ